MSKQPAVKPKTTAAKPPSRRTTEKATGKKPTPEKSKPKKEEVKVDDDEAYARQLQEELLREQEQSDAELARRLHDEEHHKVGATMPLRRPGQRPMSATPLSHIFQTMFGMRPQTLEDDDENVTPAMDTDSTDSDSSPGASAPRFPRVRRQSPEPTLPALLRRREPRPDHEATSPEVPDSLPGVRVNPIRIPPHRGFRRIVIGRPLPRQPDHEEEEEDDSNNAVVRPLSAINRPGLGPREGTMLPPEGEFEPDLMMLDTPLSPVDGTRDDNFVHIMRDPFLLLLLLMGRDPGFMVPDDIDVGDYEALWELAERLGEVRNRGMKEEEIKKLPTRTYQQKLDAKHRDETCSICLSEFKNGDKVQILPCQHEYHKDCLVEWLKRNATCPVCRQDVKGRS